MAKRKRTTQTKATATLSGEEMALCAVIARVLSRNLNESKQRREASRG